MVEILGRNNQVLQKKCTGRKSSKFRTARNTPRNNSVDDKDFDQSNHSQYWKLLHGVALKKWEYLYQKSLRVLLRCGTTIQIAVFTHSPTNQFANAECVPGRLVGTLCVARRAEAVLRVGVVSLVLTRVVNLLFYSAETKK